MPSRGLILSWCHKKSLENFKQAATWLDLHVGKITLEIEDSGISLCILNIQCQIKSCLLILRHSKIMNLFLKEQNIPNKKGKFLLFPGPSLRAPALHNPKGLCIPQSLEPPKLKIKSQVIWLAILLSKHKSIIYYTET